LTCVGGLGDWIYRLGREEKCSGHFEEALVALLGKDAGGLSASIFDGFFAHCVL
jgi:hypothetical protein